jgi:methionyl-tRNA formyltransferase
MKISILTSDPDHPVVPQLRLWRTEMEAWGHDVAICFDKRELAPADILFLISCGEILTESDRRSFGTVLVLHASELPQGRGWSPHIWAILCGASRITVCMLEAAEPVDSGPVWLTIPFELEGHELLPEINALLFKAELTLMTDAVVRFSEHRPVPQSGEPGPYMKRRTPEDSRLDPGQTLAEQFDLLRVVDNDRYPAFFDHRGHRYVLRIAKVDDDA